MRDLLSIRSLSALASSLVRSTACGFFVEDTGQSVVIFIKSYPLLVRDSGKLSQKVQVVFFEQEIAEVV